jgi:FtsH-binding integral membrane protein
MIAISVIGVIIFTGLTAYDTQRIKEMYLESHADEVEGKKAIGLMAELTGLAKLRHV